MTKFTQIDVMPPRIYAIGDIHGCLSETNTLLSHIEETQNLQAEDLVVFIGDYIDRGEESREVIDRLISFQHKHANTIFLRGNHEDMFLGFLGLPGTLGESFLANGGKQTLLSYGIDPSTPADQVMPLLPAQHYSFFLNLESYIITPEFVLVHAGLNPLRDLRAQLDEDLFWIRDEFIHNIHRFEKTVVFGHTPYQDVMYHPPFKIGIDTGLVYGNKISCVELVSGTIFQVRSGEKEVLVRLNEMYTELATS
jgi:serine/threonine protein phosphatase 1